MAASSLVKKGIKKVFKQEKPKGVRQRLATDLPKDKPAKKTPGNKGFEREASRKDPETGGSVNIGRGIDYDISKGRIKIANAKPLNFLEAQKTKASDKRAKLKVALEKISKDKSVPKKDRDRAKATFNKMEKEDEARATTRNIRASQTLRAKGMEVTLPKVKGVDVKEKGSKIEFYSDKTGEVVGSISKKEYQGMTKMQRDRYLKNLDKRSQFMNLEEDVKVTKARDAKYNRGVTRITTGKPVKGHTPRKEELKKGGKLRGMGVALRGGGKVMKR